MISQITFWFFLSICLPLILAVPAPIASGSVLPFFVYNHHALIRTRLDPIVSPGHVSAHTHVFSGANRITADASFASVNKTQCTTAPLTIDKSLYWAPQLYYKDEDNKYTIMSGEGVVTYWFYHIGEHDPDSFPELPDDFRMVAGSLKRDSLDMSRAADQAVSLQCFGPGYDFRVPYIPADFECETIRPQVGFPNCWDGVNSFKEDGSHVAYGEGDYEYGNCPEGFVRIPTLFLETYYKPKKMIGDKYKWRPGALVFAHGDNFGLTFHADWLNGFPKGALNEAYDQCKTVFDGTVASCPYFAKFENAEADRDCQADGHIVNEAVGIDAPLDHLPGNNVEYNSSAIANKPKVVDSSYIEQAILVEIDPAHGGICKSQQCTDYTGPADDPEAIISASVSEETASKSVGSVAVPTGGAIAAKSSGGLVEYPTKAGQGSTVSDAGCEEGKTTTVYKTVYVTGLPPAETTFTASDGGDNSVPSAVSATDEMISQARPSVARSGIPPAASETEMSGIGSAASASSHSVNNCARGINGKRMTNCDE